MATYIIFQTPLAHNSCAFGCSQGVQKSVRLCESFVAAGRDGALDVQSNDEYNGKATYSRLSRKAKSTPILSLFFNTNTFSVFRTLQREGGVRTIFASRGRRGPAVRERRLLELIV